MLAGPYFFITPGNEEDSPALDAPLPVQHTGAYKEEFVENYVLNGQVSYVSREIEGVGSALSLTPLAFSLSLVRDHVVGALLIDRITLPASVLPAEPLPEIEHCPQTEFVVEHCPVPIDTEPLPSIIELEEFEELAVSAAAATGEFIVGLILLESNDALNAIAKALSGSLPGTQLSDALEELASDAAPTSGIFNGEFVNEPLESLAAAAAPQSGEFDPVVIEHPHNHEDLRLSAAANRGVLYTAINLALESLRSHAQPTSGLFVDIVITHPHNHDDLRSSAQPTSGTVQQLVQIHPHNHEEARATARPTRGNIFGTVQAAHEEFQTRARPQTGSIVIETTLPFALTVSVTP